VHLAQDLQSAHDSQRDGAVLEAIAGLGHFLWKEQRLAVAGRRHSPAISLCTPKGQKVWSLASVPGVSMGLSVTQHDKKPMSSCHESRGE